MQAGDVTDKTIVCLSFEKLLKMQKLGMHVSTHGNCFVHVYSNEHASGLCRMITNTPQTDTHHANGQQHSEQTECAEQGEKGRLVKHNGQNTVH